jgi:hypothetical protein
MTLTITRRGTDIAPGAIRFYCGRGSPLGNPHVARNRSDKERDRVCDLYADGFPTKEQDAECRYMLNHADIKGFDTIELDCFCQHHGVGKRCHCETIKRYIETLL